MSTESADYRKGFAAGRDDARSQIDELCDDNVRLEAERDEARTRAQRLEASLVLTEDQRDAARAELLSAQQLSAAAMDTVHAGIAAYNDAIAERDALREQLDDMQAGMRQWEDDHASAVAGVIAERDALRKQLDDLKRDYTDTSYWARQ